MLIVISPAKKLNENQSELPDGHEITEPEFASAADELAAIARKLSIPQLQKLSGISESLAKLNQQRFQQFSSQPAPGVVLPAIHCFAGDTYQGLVARTMSAEGLKWAEQRLRILSGLYGLLRPFDGIQPYRLEMSSKLRNAAGPDLYAYWGDRISASLTRLANTNGTDTILNCASVEYFTAANRDTLKLNVITPVFLEDTGGETKMVSFWAKRARGAMARFVCENQITKPSHLREFASDGYGFRDDLSSQTQLVFVRSAVSKIAA